MQKLNFTLFLDALKDKFVEQGFQEKIAAKIISFMQFERLEENIIYIKFNNEFYKDTIIKGHYKEIKELASVFWNSAYHICIADLDGESDGLWGHAPVPKRRAKVQSQSVLFQDAPAVALPMPAAFAPVKVLPENSTVDGRNHFSTFASKNHLITHMTFENFVCGQSNMVAYSACEAVSRYPGVKSNPVFIYGKTGLGKTHLMHAVGNAILKTNPGWNVVYVTSGDFMNAFIGSLRFHKQVEFREYFRSCDVLLFDDIQFLENKDTTQLEFFHTFNDLYIKNKQIVITSDKYPKDIPNIEERLKSRFLQGLIADIEPPSFEDRVSIIGAKTLSMAMELSEESIRIIAQYVESNVREIQGVLNNLSMSKTMTGQNPNEQTVAQMLNRLMKTQGTPDMLAVQKAVAQHYGIPLPDLLSANRVQKFTIPRHVAMYLSKEILDVGIREIAEAFGKKDHTTVLHGIQRIRDLMVSDGVVRAQVNEIKRLVAGVHRAD